MITLGRVNIGQNVDDITAHPNLRYFFDWLNHLAPYAIDTHFPFPIALLHTSRM